MPRFFKDSAMNKKSLETLGELQRTVLEIIWHLGQASVHQVREHLNHQKELAYTTVLTALQKLEKAGWLDHHAEGKSYVYYPTRTREEAGARFVQRFMKQVFDGDAVSLFQHLIQETDLSDEELNQLREMIEHKRKEAGHVE
jgi:BlaI family penicillinase repressor